MPMAIGKVRVRHHRRMQVRERRVHEELPLGRRVPPDELDGALCDPFVHHN